MTQPKFKVGDKVKTNGGLDGEIVQVNTNGSAALVNAGKGETFESSWYSTDSLKKGRAAAQTKPADDTTGDTSDKAAE